MSSGRAAGPGPERSPRTQTRASARPGAAPRAGRAGTSSAGGAGDKQRNGTVAGGGRARARQPGGPPPPAGRSQGPHTPAEPPGGGWRARLLSLLQDEAVASTVTPWGAPSGVRLVPVIDGLGVHCQWLRITSGGTERGHGGPRIPRVTADSPGCKWHFRPFVEITAEAGPRVRLRKSLGDALHIHVRFERQGLQKACYQTGCFSVHFSPVSRGDHFRVVVFGF